MSGSPFPSVSQLNSAPGSLRPFLAPNRDMVVGGGEGRTELIDNVHQYILETTDTTGLYDRSVLHGREIANKAFDLTMTGK